MEKSGFEPTIYEASDRVGGRVKTDELDGAKLDHGFQVLLTAYPEAKKYLDFDQLNLNRFSPGSLLFYNSKKDKIGDPARDPSFLWSTLTSSVGSFKDKLLILRLSNRLKKKSLDDIFSSEELTTMNYLKNQGFSQKVIERFFQPFFAGIFLEENLDTSSRMFEFVYKMFSMGHAAVPEDGMQAIPKQLSDKLTSTNIELNKPVERIIGKTIHLKNGEKVEADQIIIATESTHLLDESPKSKIKWKSCLNIYFQCKNSSFGEPIIGLLPTQTNLVNNFHFLSDVFQDSGESNVLSVTVVKDHGLTDVDLINTIKQELQASAGIEIEKMLKSFEITRALPDLNDLRYSPRNEEVCRAKGVYCCGDHLAYGSLNAAMLSGRFAADAVIRECRDNELK